MFYRAINLVIMFCVASMYVRGCHWCMIFHEANIWICLIIFLFMRN